MYTWILLAEVIQLCSVLPKIEPWTFQQLQQTYPPSIMFRITYSDAISQEWRGRVLEMPDTKTRRVYRWGTHWGILDEKWSCESRVVRESSDACVVEQCTSVNVDTLPMEMDDLWEEEYVSFSKSLEYTGLVILLGDARTVLETAAAQGLPTPSLPKIALSENRPKVPSVPLAHPPARKERRCFIRD